MISNIEIHVKNNVTPRTFKAAAKTGKVQFYRVRKNGTTRHIPFLAKGTKEREIAEAVETDRANGATVAELAASMGVSQPTVRRYIERLNFTREVERAKAAEIAPLLEHAKHDEPANGQPTR